jgi:hypothetical protein
VQFFAIFAKKFGLTGKWRKMPPASETIKKHNTTMRTTFNRLRAVKDSLPHGSMDAIAAELNISGEDVRAYFNGEGTADYHLEPGPDGGIVVFSNTRILEVALRKAWEVQNAL